MAQARRQADAVRRPRRSHSLRHRIGWAIVGVASVALLLFAVPLAASVGRLNRSQELTELQSDATRIVALVPDNPVDRNTAPPLPDARDSDATVGIYTVDGQRAGGSGPAHSVIARAAHDGQVHRGRERGSLVVVVPVPSDSEVVAVVRAAASSSGVTARTRRTWAAMGLLGLAVLMIAALLARRQARRIAEPLERLTQAARRLGEGDFTAVQARSGIAEADAAAAALQDTAVRLGALLERERAFSMEASHQLRTPLTGLMLGIESALDRPTADLRRALLDALERTSRLSATVDDLRALRRDAARQPASVDVELEVGHVYAHWQPILAAAGRALRLEAWPGLPAAGVSAAAVRQILDVLLANALHHGAETVTISTVDLGDAVAVEVADEGAGLPGDPEAAFVRRSPDARGHGIGLALARSLAEAEGGRLVPRRPGSGPVMALLLPISESVVATAQGARRVTARPQNGSRDPAGS